MEYKNEHLYEEYLAHIWGVQEVNITNEEIVITLRKDNNFDPQAESFWKAYEIAKNDSFAQKILKIGVLGTMNIIDELTHEITLHISKIADGKLRWKYNDKTAKNINQLKRIIQ